MARLAVDNLHATYRNANGNEILHGVSFGLDEGQAFLIHGHNGSGKSTLLKVLAGLIPATAGTVSWNFSTEPANRAGQAIRDWMGFQMQAQNVFDGLSVRRNVRLAATGRNLPASACEDGVRDQFPLLQPLWNKRAGLLSGGQRKVLALAMATLGDPPVLLLDEPMAGLSGESASAVLTCLYARKASGTILIVVEHSVNRLGNGLIDLHAEMTEGRLTETEEIPTDPTLDLLRTRVEHWERFSNSIDPYGKEPLQPLYDTVNSFLQRHAKISYNDFRGQCKPWEWTEDSYGLFPRGSIKRALFDHIARLLLAALSDCEEMGIPLSDLLRVLGEYPIPPISQTPFEPTVQAIAAVLRKSPSAGT